MEECKQVHRCIEIHLVTCRFECFMYRSELSTHARRSPVINKQVNIARFRGDRYILPFVAPRPSAFCPLLLKKTPTNSGSVTGIESF